MSGADQGRGTNGGASTPPGGHLASRALLTRTPSGFLSPTSETAKPRPFSATPRRSSPLHSRSSVRFAQITRGTKWPAVQMCRVRDVVGCSGVTRPRYQSASGPVATVAASAHDHTGHNPGERHGPSDDSAASLSRVRRPRRQRFALRRAPGDRRVAAMTATPTCARRAAGAIAAKVRGRCGKDRGRGRPPQPPTDPNAPLSAHRQQSFGPFERGVGSISAVFAAIRSLSAVFAAIRRGVILWARVAPSGAQLALADRQG